MAAKLNKMREEIVQKFIAALSENRIPWQRNWNINIATNAISGKVYNGVNRLYLAIVASENGYGDNRWCTFKQAQQKGCRIKAGEHGTPIEFWSFYDQEKKSTILPSEMRKRIDELKAKGVDWKDIIFPVSRVYTVFNAEQIDGMPPIDKVVLPENEELINNRNKLINSLGISFKEGGNKACYVPDKDEIRMPLWEDFKSEYGYMATFLHEAAHSTGAEHRLNRQIKNKFGTQDYAKEELRAEIASAFMSQQLGFGNVERLDNHSAYIQSWISVLQNEPNELFSAIKDAEVISDYLLEKGEFELVKNELIMPDDSITRDEMIEYGYSWGPMLPVRTAKAKELFKNNMMVFMLYEDDTESMAECLEDIDCHDGIFGVERDAWIKNLEDKSHSVEYDESKKTKDKEMIKDEIDL